MWTRACPPLVLATELALFYRKVIFFPTTYVIPWDFHYYHYNLAQFLASALRQGRLPLWDPYTYCGQPYFANLTTQMFYPPALVTAGLAAIAGLDYLQWLETAALVVHLLFAGIMTYWLLREADTGIGAALIGATAFELGCYFASQTQHVGAMEGACWLPVCALAILKLSQRAGSRWVAVLAVGLAASILTGFPSATVAVVIAVLMLALCLRIFRTTLIALAAAVALSAVQLLPTLQLSALSVAKYRRDFRGPGSGIRLEALPSLVWPNYHHILDLNGYRLPYNFTFLYLYCGLPVLLLAILAMVQRRHRLAAPFAMLTAGSALLMFGDATLPGRYLNPLVLDLTRDSVYPEFLLAAFSFGIAVLAGLGAQRFATRPWILALLLIATVLDLTSSGSSRPMNTAELVRDPGVTATQFDGSAELVEKMRALVNQSDPPDRVDTHGDSMSWSMMASTTRIPSANGNEPFALASIMSVRRKFCGGERGGRYYEVANLESPVLDQAGVRYLIAREPLPSSPKYSLVASLPGHLVYENRSVLPRFSLSGWPVQVKRYAPETIELEVDSKKPALLITAEADYPGWFAYIDGRRVPIVRANGAFRGVEVPVGHHRIVFRFMPSILAWGTLVSVIAGAALFWFTRPRHNGPVER